MKVPFPPEFNHFVAPAGSKLPVPAKEVEWPSFALVEESTLSARSGRTREADLAVGCLECLSGMGAAIVRLLVLEEAYERALDVGQANDLHQRVGRRIIDSLAADLAVVDFVVGGAGLVEALQREPPLLRRVEMNATYRLLAALFASGDFAYARTLIRKAFRASEAAGAEIASHKTFLQETLARAKRGTPSYVQLERSGPAHASTFLVSVTTADGRRAEGQGTSKRRAEEAAAKAYLETHWAREIQAFARSNSSRRKQRVWPDPPLRHAGVSFELLARQFGIPEEGLPLLSLALTHRGELGSATHGQHWQSLAQIGAATLEVITGTMLLEEGIAAGRWVTSPEIASTRARETSASTTAFADLHLERLFIAPPNARTERVRSDAFQAVVAAALLSCHAEPSPSLLPEPIERHFRSLVREGVRSPARELYDPKTALQELLAAIRVDYLFEIDRFEGPANDRTFYPRVTLKSRLTTEEIVVRGGSGRSRAEADKQLAREVRKVLTIALGMTGGPPISLGGKPRAQELARFFLRSSLAALSSDPLAVGRMAGIDALGAPALAARDTQAFAMWAGTAEALLGEPIDSHAEGFLRYFRHLGSLAETGGTASYGDEVAAIVEFVRGLDPESYIHDLRETEGFRLLLALAAASRLRSHPVKHQAIAEILDEIGLLHRNHPPRISVAQPVHDCVVHAREGVIQALIEEIVRSLEAAQEVRVRAMSGGGHLTLTFAADAVIPPAIQMTGPLWELFAFELPELHAETTAEAVQISFRLEHDQTSPFVSAALLAYQGSTSVEAAESEALAHVLHDLKNRLISFHLALAHPHVDRTARLKARLEASQHLDASTLLCDALTSIGSSLAEPDIARIDVGRFFRDYFAEKYGSLPANIELAVPSRADGIEMTTSGRYLRSILDNLIKNAVEAMPNGGPIRCEWLADTDEGRLLVEVADAGVGIAPEDLDALLRGRGILSRKREGSGVGMMTVVAMVGRLGGTVSGESSVGSGTRWMIELPSVVEEEPTHEREVTGAHSLG